MANSFTLSILTPEKNFYSEPVEEIIFDTPTGRMGVMAGYMTSVAVVAEGIVEILADGQWKTAAVSQGFVEIDGGKAELFVDTAEWSDEIDIVRATQALERAEMRLKTGLSRVEYVRSQAAMARALARIKAAKSVRRVTPD